MARLWTTSDRPPAEQFSYWREVVCEAFTPLAPRLAASRNSCVSAGIKGWVRSNLLTATNCAEITSTTQRIDHGRDEVRRTHSEHVFVNLQLAGHCVASQGGRTCIVPAGGFAMFDTTSEYRLDFFGDTSGEWRVVSFRVPRGDLLPLVADPDRITAITHDGRTSGLDAVLASTMRSTWENLDRLDRDAAHSVESAYTAMLAAAAGGSEHLRETRRESLDATLRAAINRYLAAHLHGTDLSTARVARRFGISERKLYALYADADLSYAQTVMHLRVKACSAELDRGTHRTLTELAAHWGFSDLSHLNRVFRTHHGCLPSQYRNAAATD